tara:strand:- start:216 stop:704 length:489 start_codon:yes stop_codon:yes gene_type:complete
MIQRIQSILLLISAMAMGLMLFFPLWQKVSIIPPEDATLDAFHLAYDVINPTTGSKQSILKNTFYIALLGSLSAAISLYSIFQYKNRLRQIQLGSLNSLLIGMTLGLIMYFVFKAETLLAPTRQGNYLLGFYLPLASLLCNFTANRFIRKDEKLIKSMDRIR